MPSPITQRRQNDDLCLDSRLREPLSIAIRKAEDKDLECLAEVLTQSFHPFKGLSIWLQPLLKLGIYEDLRTRLHSRSPHNICLVAVAAKERGEEKEQIVGTIEISLSSPKVWLYSANKNRYPYISNLAVSSSFRRRGVARQLLAKCDCIALGSGCQQIDLHVLENNDRAQKLYYGSGYKLDRAEWGWIDWLFQRPRRLLLRKKL